VCHQSVGLIARHVEAAGIPTLCMTSALDITQAVNPPRAAFLDFPLGHTTGKPHQPELQRAIMREALDAFVSLTAPGAIKTLPFRWSTDNAWKDTAQRGPDDRRPRYDTPQYQNDEDRQRAETCTMMQEEQQA
jgi:D-proline reductase (dithiol) PrdB